MNRKSLVPLAYFGKIPSRGDFVRSANQPGLIQTLDHWLSKGLELLSTDPRWKEIYDRRPKANFVFFSVNDTHAVAGHMAASHDAAGRRFPIAFAGPLEADGSLDFMTHAPMGLARLWAHIEQAAQSACTEGDPRSIFGELAHAEIELDMTPAAYEASLRDFGDLHSLGSLETMLRNAGHAIDLRQALLALGLLLQPVLSSAGQPLKKGLRLPLPADPLYRPLVASYWLEVVLPFLRHLDLELALFFPQRAGNAAQSMLIGFSGAAAAHLHALLDPRAAADSFIDPTPADWVEDHVQRDSATKKLSVSLQQSALSLRQVTATFRETFLGQQ